MIGGKGADQVEAAEVSAKQQAAATVVQRRLDGLPAMNGDVEPTDASRQDVDAVEQRRRKRMIVAEDVAPPRRAAKRAREAARDRVENTTK
jgi:hypothetical protein